MPGALVCGGGFGVRGGMTDADKPAAEAEPPVAAATPAGASQLLVDLGPIAVFAVAYNVLNKIRPNEAIFIATGIFIAVTLAAIAYSWWRSRKLPPVLIVTGILVTTFGGLTLILHDENFIKIKPTIAYLFYATSIFGALAFGQNIWKLLFQHVFTLPDRIWRILAWRWGAFFVFLAILNEVIRRTQDTGFWANSKVFIFFPLTLGFALLHAPMTLKYMGKTDESAPEA